MWGAMTKRGNWALLAFLAAAGCGGGDGAGGSGGAGGGATGGMIGGGTGGSATGGTGGSAAGGMAGRGTGGAGGSATGGMGGSAAATAQPITLTAVLVAGDVTAAPSTVQKIQAGDKLVGYKLYCVTFSMQPAAGTGTSDAMGKVTVTLAASGVPFGCFVRDPMDKTVASVIFAGGGQSGQSASLTASSDFGMILVDTMRGLAQAMVPSGGRVASTNTSSVPCPLGTWVVDYGTPSCVAGRNFTGTFYIAREPNGDYLVTSTTGPQRIGDQCTYWSEIIRSTYVNGKLRVVSPSKSQSCAARVYWNELTPDADCRTAKDVGGQDGCAMCPTGGTTDCGCGTMTCAATLTATRL